MDQVGSHKTSVFAKDGKTYVIYRYTAVVCWDGEAIVLNSGGWHTVTTKARMNQAANQYGLGYHVFQKDHKWYVNISQDGGNVNTVDFEDGMRIDRKTRKVSQ